MASFFVTRLFSSPMKNAFTGQMHHSVLFFVSFICLISNFTLLKFI